LVTGATGFIGSHLVDELLKLNYQITCLVRKTSNLKWLIGKNVKLIEASLSDSSSYAFELQEIDMIFHVAGVTFAKNKDDFFKGNFQDTKIFLETVKDNAKKLKRFVFISSQTVAGPSESLENPKNELSPCNPITTYGKSKKLAEDEVMKFSDDFPVTIIRASAVYGPRDSAIYAVFKSIKMGIATIVGIRKPKYLNLIHSKDLVDGIILASHSKKTIGQIYFLSSEEIYTWDKLIPIIAEKMGNKYYLTIRFPHFLVLITAGLSELFNKFSKKPSVFNYEKGIDFIQDYWICSVEKAGKDFGFKQNVSIDEGISQTISWYKENKWL
jgi:nucleoside-diphosphate-sugar epimerase